MKMISTENISSWSQTTAENHACTPTEQKNVKKNLLRDISRKHCDHKRAYKGRSDYSHLLLHRKIVDNREFNGWQPGADKDLMQGRSEESMDFVSLIS